ncbi:MAG: sugar ABC transporter permease, partial [Candidatus Eisenbacteria bacterium]|nr:sugar ABC transporter permease [Candidatus Eisenbacteria bacterium]
GTIWTFNNLNVMWIVTRGGQPSDKSHILVTYVYKAAFTYYRYGYAAAFSVLIFLILLGFVLWYLKTTHALREERR